MSFQLIEAHQLGGIGFAQVDFASAASLNSALVAAPSSGKMLELLYICAGQSAPGSLRLTTGTAAATTYWTFNVTGVVAEECKIPLDDATGLNIFATNGVGNGYIRVYYRIRLNTGNDHA